MGFPIGSKESLNTYKMFLPSTAEQAAPMQRAIDIATGKPGQYNYLDIVRGSQINTPGGTSQLATAQANPTAVDLGNGQVQLADNSTMSLADYQQFNPRGSVTANPYANMYQAPGYVQGQPTQGTTQAQTFDPSQTVLNTMGVGNAPTISQIASRAAQASTAPASNLTSTDFARQYLAQPDEASQMSMLGNFMTNAMKNSAAAPAPAPEIATPTFKSTGAIRVPTTTVAPQPGTWQYEAAKKAAAAPAAPVRPGYVAPSGRTYTNWAPKTTTVKK